MEEKQRNYLIDNGKGLMIFLVVLGHGLELLRKEYELTRIIYVFIYLFHMPVFIFISGYLSKNIEKGRKQAVQSLLIPFLFFNSIWGIVQIVSIQIAGGTYQELSINTAFSFLVPGWALWYIFSMFLWKILLPDILKVKKVFVVAIIVGLGTRLFSEFSVFMSLARTLVFFPYFLAGYYFSEDKLESMKKYGLLPGAGILVSGLLLAVGFVKYTNIPDEFLWADRSYNSFELSYPALQGMLIGALLYLIGFGMIYAVIAILPTKKTFLCKIGSNTRAIYFLHPYLIGLVIGSSNFLDSNVGKLLITIAASLAVTLFLSINKISQGLDSLLGKINRKIFVGDNVL